MATYKKGKGGQGQIVVHGSKMAKDKSIVEVGTDITSSSNAGVAHCGLYPEDSAAAQVANRPLTVSGLRWNLTPQNKTVTTRTVCKWVIWIRRKAQAIDNAVITLAGVQDAFGKMDESDVLVWGHGALGSGVNPPFRFEGATKTQRKMQQGDTLVLSVWTNTTGATDIVSFAGIVQTFLKS